MTAIIGTLSKYASKAPVALEHFNKTKSDTSSWEKVAKFSLATLKLAAPQGATQAKEIISFGIASLNALQISNPLRYFYLGEYTEPKNNNLASDVFWTSHLYLSTVDVVSWFSEHTKDVAQFARTVGTSLPLVGRVVSAEVARFVLPAALALHTADLYKTWLGTPTERVGKDKVELEAADAIAKLWKTANIVGQITLIVFQMISITNPNVTTGLLVVELLTHTAGLVSDGYGFYNLN